MLKAHSLKTMPSLPAITFFKCCSVCKQYYIQLNSELKNSELKTPVRVLFSNLSKQKKHQANHQEKKREDNN